MASFVNVSHTAGQSLTSFAVSVSGLTAGNLLVIGFTALPTTTTISSVTDNSTTPGIYQSIEHATTSAFTAMYMGVCPPTPPTTITITCASSTTTGIACVAQYSGLIGFLARGTATFSSTTAPSVTATITHYGDWAVALYGYPPASSSTITSANGNFLRLDIGDGINDVDIALADNYTSSGTSVINALTLSQACSGSIVYATLYTSIPTLPPIPTGGTGILEGTPQNSLIAANTYEVTASTLSLVNNLRPTTIATLRPGIIAKL